MSRVWHSLSFRLALLYAAVLSISMTLVAAAYFVIAIWTPMSALRDEVAAEAAGLAALYAESGRGALVNALLQRTHDDEAHRAFHAFFAADGTEITSNLPSVPSEPFSGWMSIEADIYIEGDEVDYSAMSLDQVFADGARLIVGRDAEDLEDTQEMFLDTVAWVILLTLALGVAGGFVMSRALGGRIDAISGAARKVMDGDMSGRVPVRGSGDDFDRLGETLNLMLARNERLMESIRRVSDHVAHELRTPLARLMSQLEQLEAADDPARLKAMRGEALEEAHRLQRIFDALLRISRLEGGRFEAEFRDTDLVELAADARDLYAPAAKERRISLSVAATPKARAKVERELIFQALANMLDNALKHTGDGGAIIVGVESREGDVVLSVSDNGVGLLPGEAERVTERFFRGQAAEGKPGEGLGLSIVAAIVALHGGRLRFIDNAPGLRVELSLPA